MTDRQPILSFLTKVTFPEESVASANDQLTHPPVSQSFDTDDYRFVVTATDEWQTPAATGTLYKSDPHSGELRLVWEKPLPHQYGPRFVVVGLQGQVLLADEFINVASPYALMLLDVAGEPVATYSFEDIQQVLQVSAAELTQRASSGWWISAEPQREQPELAQSGDSIAAERVVISTGGTHLSVNLLTGELTPHLAL